MGSEAIRRIVALGTVALAVVVQSVATRDAGADQSFSAHDFGVKLLEAQLSAPLSPAGPFAPSPTAAGPTLPAATFLAQLAEPAPLLSQSATREPVWLDALPSEVGPDVARVDRSLDRELLNRDSVGSLIEISENDVLIPARLTFLGGTR